MLMYFFNDKASDEHMQYVIISGPIKMAIPEKSHEMAMSMPNKSHENDNVTTRGK